MSDCPYARYYLNQAGNGVAVFEGQHLQRGHGLGSVFSSLFRVAKPFLRQGGRYIARHALNTGSAFANDVLNGENWRESGKGI